VLNKTVLYFLLTLCSFIFLAWVFSTIFSYVIISLILSTIFTPLANKINQVHLFGVKIPRFFAVIFSFAAIIVIISLFVILFIPLITEQIDVITRLDYENIYDRVSTPLQSVEQYFIKYKLTAQAEGFIVETLRSNFLELVQSISFGEILNQLISFTGNVFVGVIAVAFITFILLYDHGIFRRQIIKLIPNQYFEVFIVVIYKIENLLSNYLIGILLQMLSIFCIASLGLTIVGVKYALTIAIFAAVANLIPYAGPLLGTIFGIAVGISTGGVGLEGNAIIFLVIKIVSVFAIVQLVDNLLIQPLIFSKSVKAHPLEIFLVIFAGATLAGILGMIAAIPVYTVLRVIFGELYNGYKQYYVFQAK